MTWNRLQDTQPLFETFVDVMYIKWNTMENRLYLFLYDIEFMAVMNVKNSEVMQNHKEWIWNLDGVHLSTVVNSVM
jgi:hypothetical protein